MHHSIITRGIAAAVLASVMLTGCRESATGPSADAAAKAAASESPDSLFARVVRMGFPADLIREVGDAYIVDGDMVVTKASLRAEAREERSGLRRPDDRAKYQYRTTYTANLQNNMYNSPPTIGVDLTAIAAESPAWTAAIRAAIANWGSLPGAQVYFAEGTGYNYQLTFVFGACDNRPETIACSQFPTQQCTYLGCYTLPGNRIDITRQPGNASLTDGERVFAMTHEMGHSVGFRHTDWNNRLCMDPTPHSCTEGEAPFGAILIPGTPASTLGGPREDANSVMNAIVQSWNGFSTYDRIAARYLFPGGAGPTPTLGASETPTITWSPMQDAISYEVWFVQPQGCGSPICFGPDPADVETYVGATTGTSYVDNSRTRTSACYSGPMYARPGAYRIKAVFADNGRKSNLGAYASCY